MGNRQSHTTIEFINESEIPKVEVQVGNYIRTLASRGITKFEISVATPSIIRGYDKSGRLIHELKFTLGIMAASQVWKITNSGVKHRRSPFFTETVTWNQKQRM